jgi:hypothetical protein
MRKHVTAWTVVGLLATLIASRARAADDATVLRDLTSAIALQGLPCGQVVSVVKQGDNDYVASCQDGNRYHVFVNAQGRVIVQKQ